MGNCVRLLRPAVLGLLAAMLSGNSVVHADEPVSVDVTLKEHRFIPPEIRVSSGKRVDLRIRNEDATAEEFDSSDLKIEKVIAGGTSAVVRLRPLAPGRFRFMGEFHPETAQGVVISQ